MEKPCYMDRFSSQKIGPDPSFTLGSDFQNQNLDSDPFSSSEIEKLGPNVQLESEQIYEKRDPSINFHHAKAGCPISG